MTDRFVTVPDSLELPAAVKVPVARLVGPTGAPATPADLGLSATRGLIVTAVDVPTIPDGDTLDNLAAYYNSGASPVTVAGVELAAGSHAVWVWVSGAWVLLSSGTSTPPVDPSDTTPPVWSATLTTGTPTETSVVVAASALATDDVAVTGYRWRLTGEGPEVARTIVPSGTNFTLDGLTPSTAYAAPIIWAVDAGGNKSAELVAQGFTTDAAPPGWVIAGADSFTGADGTPLASRALDTGGAWSSDSTAKIYGNKISRPNVADASDSIATLPLTGAVTKARLTVDFDKTGAKSGNDRFWLGFNTNGESTCWATIRAEDGRISTNSWHSHTFTEVSGLTGNCPTTGTATVEFDLAAKTLKFYVNGSLLRSWTIAFTGVLGTHVRSAFLRLDRYGEDTAVSSLDNFVCEEWR